MRPPLPGVLAVLSWTPLAAQRPGTIELGVFARYTRFDHATGPFRARAGVGGRLGAVVLPDLALEGEVSYTTTRSRAQDLIRYVPIHARLVYHAPLSTGYVLLLGGGYTRTLFRSAYRETSDGAGGVLGFRIGAGPATIRLEGTADFIVNPETARGTQVAGATRKSRNWHLGAQAGLSFFLGRGRAGWADRDRDGVGDSFDLCPASPPGPRVDRSGCPLPADSDGDGVADPLDQCPATPAGKPVDQSGCPPSPAPPRVEGGEIGEDPDRCSAPSGAGELPDGCLLDRDGDGVADREDRCPGTEPGVPVDRVGCPRSPEERPGLVLERVRFAPNSAALDVEAQAILARVAASLVAHPEVTV